MKIKKGSHAADAAVQQAAESHAPDAPPPAAEPPHQDITQASLATALSAAQAALAHAADLLAQLLAANTAQKLGGPQPETQPLASAGPAPALHGCHKQNVPDPLKAQARGPT